MRFEDKLAAYEILSDEARHALICASRPARMFSKGATLQIEGDPAVAASLVVDGLARSYRSVLGAGQQMLALHFAGDVVGLSTILSGHLVCGLTALTPVTIAQIPKDALLALIEEQPQLGRLLWRDMARDALIAQEWLVGLGRRAAYARTAHLICEIFVRQSTAKVITGAACPFPLNQPELADALGLSVVHVNRVLQRLRGEGLISLFSGTLTIRDWEGLVAVAGFDPAYLAPFCNVLTVSASQEPA